MPVVTVDYAAGLHEADRHRMQVCMAEAVMQAFQAPPHTVRVLTRAVDPGDVYMADGHHHFGLPVIRVEFLPGRNLDQKRALVKALTHAAAEILNVPLERVRTILYEKAREDWARGDELVADAP
ncbi:MAG: tautomerase family protein [Bacillota bacterium]